MTPIAPDDRIARHPREIAAARATRGPLRAWRRAALIAVPVVACFGLSAQAAFKAIATGAPVTRAAPAPLSPVPIRAAPTPDIASPATGTTGTIELPPEPMTKPLPTTFESTIVPAQPFAAMRGSPADRGRALQCLTAAIYYEAASESDDGQRAVAQVVLNRARHPAFPATVCGVVYQGSERTSGCQFSFACDGAMARVPSRTGWARAMRIAGTALAGQVYAPVGLATHYHTYAVTPYWNRTLVMTDAIGAHFFHRWKGYWGTAIAFRQSYRGGEPFPGPHPRAVPLPGMFAKPVLAAVAPAASVAAAATIAAIQPAYADSGTPRAPVTASADSQILDKWKDSGKPLR